MIPADALRALLAQLEAASEGCRELNEGIGVALEGISISTGAVEGGGMLWALPSYTHSLDAAVDLCERIYPDARWSVCAHGIDAATGRMTYLADVDLADDTWGDGAKFTPALALCIAIVRAQLK